MSVTSSALSSAILTSAPEMTGGLFKLIAQTVGTVVSVWSKSPSNLALQGITTGSAGSGVVLGSLVVPPNIAIVSQAFKSSGILGPTSPQLARAIAIGISTVFSTAQYTGPSVGVGVGSDISQIKLANFATLYPAMLSQFKGATSNLISIGISKGVTELLLLGSGIGVVSGPPAPSSGTGLSGPSTIF